jgi:hypothetical protein
MPELASAPAHKPGVAVMQMAQKKTQDLAAVNEWCPQDCASPVRLPTAAAGLATVPGTFREVPFQELELHEVIGEGAFGKVYRAVWQGSVVAVKVMPSEVYQRPDCVHQFRREVEMMSLMTPHNHVLQLVGACTTGSHFALVTGAYGSCVFVCFIA